VVVVVVLLLAETLLLFILEELFNGEDFDKHLASRRR
jgi:hypothetical protein